LLGGLHPRIDVSIISNDSPLTTTTEHEFSLVPIPSLELTPVLSPETVPLAPIPSPEHTPTLAHAPASALKLVPALTPNSTLEPVSSTITNQCEDETTTEETHDESETKLKSDDQFLSLEQLIGV